jgi:hypothetical protein
MHYKPSFRIVFIFFAKILLNFYGIFERQGIGDEFYEEFGQGKSYMLIVFRKKKTVSYNRNGPVCWCRLITVWAT